MVRMFNLLTVLLLVTFRLYSNSTLFAHESQWA